jgi:hypothetical protein
VLRLPKLKEVEELSYSRMESVQSQGKFVTSFYLDEVWSFPRDRRVRIIGKSITAEHIEGVAEWIGLLKQERRKDFCEDHTIRNFQLKC